ncbi:MAG: hypothetical protein IJU70_11950 [Lentisphaeria bacterium]|nr:hypothetical protein [Lentisphaeria bacterium]
MKCEKPKTEPGRLPDLDAEEIRDWEETSEKLSAALELLENYPAPYPPECLPAVIF